MPEPLVISVILNTNRRVDTLECLASLISGTYRNNTILVLDNNSSDGSVDAIRKEYPQVEVMQLAENLGYAGNNNVGIRAAMERGADWVFVLNEDTVLAPDCLQRMIEAAESDPKIGILGPLVYHHDEPAVIQSAGGSIGPYWDSRHLGMNEPDGNQFVKPHDVDWISGCGILVRGDVIKQVGPIDQRYFYYWEETEWCLRAGRAGWRVVHVPQSKMWHKGVQRDYRPSPTVTYYSTRNRLLTMAKHQAPLRVWFGVSIWMVRTLGSWSVRPRWKSIRPHRNAMWRGVVDFLFSRWGGPVRL
ncbi:MAG: glycosyltransferase family 2 protein [Acidobacteriota bacterium]